MDEIRVKEGKYKSEEKVIVEITTTETKEKKTEQSEEILLKTIDYLTEKKTKLIAQIDAEIAENQAMLDEIKKLDRKPFVDETIEEPKIEEIGIVK